MKKPGRLPSLARVLHSTGRTAALPWVRPPSPVRWVPASWSLAGQPSRCQTRTEDQPQHLPSTAGGRGLPPWGRVRFWPGTIQGPRLVFGLLPGEPAARFAVLAREPGALRKSGDPYTQKSSSPPVRDRARLGVTPHPAAPWVAAAGFLNPRDFREHSPAVRTQRPLGFPPTPDGCPTRVRALAFSRERLRESQPNIDGQRPGSRMLRSSPVSTSPPGALVPCSTASAAPSTGVESWEL